MCAPLLTEFMHARSRAGWQRPAASRWPVPASGHRRPLARRV
eukprot:COSAG05_NODE_106_length_18750_cov_677.083105_23_plen_41_part_01